MSARASRRQVLAAIALQADLPAPCEVRFSGPYQDGEYRISIDLDSIADLHAWLPYFGMTEKRVMVQPYTHKGGPDVGQTTTLANAYSRVGDEWRGWRVHLSALDPVGEPEQELDDATRAELTAVAEVGAPC